MLCNSHCASQTKKPCYALRRMVLASAFVLAACAAYQPQAHASDKVQTEASAEAIASASASAQANGVDPSFKAQGEGRLRFFGLHVYDAKLWTYAPVTTANYKNTPLALELTYGRSLYGKLIAERSLKEMQGVALVTEVQASAWLEAMTQLFPDVVQGDQLTGVYQPGQRAVFWLNGKRLGEVEDRAFAPAFFGIWLDEKSSEPGLRKQLLGTP